MRLSEKYPKTNLYIIDRGLWIWAKRRAEEMGFRSVSEFVFHLLAEAWREASSTHRSQVDSPEEHTSTEPQ